MDIKKRRGIGEKSFTRIALITLAYAALTFGVSYAGPLAVVSTSPANGATDVYEKTPVNVTFDQEIDPTSLYTLTSERDNIDYTYNIFVVESFNISGATGHPVRYDPTTKTATLDGYSRTSGSYDYGDTVTIALPIHTSSELPEMEEIRSLTGETMTGDYRFSFTIQYDPALPYVGAAPELVDGDYYMNETMYFTFSEHMDVSTINSTNIIITDGTDTAVGTISQYEYYDHISDETFQFTPTENLNPDTTYTMTIKKEVVDKGGQSMEADFTTEFTTNDRSFVRIISTSPEQYAAQVALDSSFSLTFDRAMDPTSMGDSIWISAENYECDGVAVFTSYDSDTNTVTLTPARDLVIACKYYVYVGTWVHSTAYESMEEEYFLYFTTGFSHYLNPVPSLSEWGMIFMVTAMIGYALTRRETFG